MKFLAKTQHKDYDGEVTYCLSENAFNYTKGYSVDILILLKYLNLAIDSETMEVKSIWGFSCKTFWNEIDLVPPMYSRGTIKLLNDYVESGCTYRINEFDSCKEYFDKNTGWYCMGDPYYDENVYCIEFAKNCAAVIKECSLIAIWLKPIFKN